MKRKKAHPSRFTRLVIYPFIGVAFVVALTVIIMLAMGYKISYDKTRLSFQKTGMIVVASNPSDAKIYLNGEDTFKRTIPLLSTKLAGLMPGKYLLSVKKDGFYKWEKSINVRSDYVSWANYILLFPEKIIPEKVDVLNGYKYIGSNKSNRYLFLEKTNDQKIREFYVFDSGNNSNKKVWPGNITPVEAWLREMQIISVEFNSDNKKLLLTLKEGSNKINFGLLEIDSNTNRLYPLKTNPALAFSKVTWNPGNTNELFGLSNGSLYRLNINESQINASKITDKVVDYRVEPNNRIHYVKNDQGIYVLKRIQTDGGRDNEIYREIVKSSKYKFEYSDKNNALALLAIDSANLAVYYDINNEQDSVNLPGKISNMSWNKEGSRLNYYNQNEVFCFNWEEQSETNFTIAESILEASWYYDNTHLFIRTDKGLYVSDYDGYNKIRISDLAKDSLNVNQSSFLYSVLEKNVSSFYKLNISF